MLIQADLDDRPAALREVLGAGEPLNPDVIARIEKAWGLTIRDGFGQTETTLQVGNTPGQPVKAGSMGRPMPGVPVVLVDPVTGELADEGEICLDLAREPLNLMTGYLGDPQRNAHVMAGGYYHTGDVASRDEDGYITYIGRTDDVFKSSDYKVSPFELESVLIEHPAVVEAAVVPQPDETRLSVPKAYVSLAEGWPADADTAKAIMEYARDHLAPYLKVRRVEFFELPKTISGKIRRVELRTREDEAHRSGTPIGTEHRYEDLMTDVKSYDAGPTDVPILEETIGANFERTVAQHPNGEALVDVAQGLRYTYAELNVEIDVVGTGFDGGRHREGRPGGHLGAQPGRVDHRPVRDRQDRRDPGQREPRLPHPRVGLRAQSVRRADADRGTGFKTSDYVAMVDEVRGDVPSLTEVIFFGTDDWSGLRERAAEVSADELASRSVGLVNTEAINIQYTSGTTGFPKGATLSHRNILNNGYFTTELIKLGPGTGCASRCRSITASAW